MNIALLELFYHQECLYSLGKALLHSNHNITIFTKESIYSELIKESGFAQFHWVTQPAAKPMKKFWFENSNLLKNQDIIIILTVESNFRLFTKINTRGKVILQIHNANCWLKPFVNIKLKFTPYYLWKDFSYFIRYFILQLDWYYKKRIIENSNFITFPQNRIKDNFSRLLPPEKILPPLPLAVFNGGKNKSPDSKKIVITIPGHVDIQRRDYYLVLRIWERLLPELGKDIELIFLGRIRRKSGSVLINKFRKLENRNFRVRCFTDRVPQDEFDLIMQSTDILLSPLIIKTRYKFYREVYGYSKLSAIESDVIRYGKPAIIPDSYKNDYTTEVFFYKYRDEGHLEEILRNIIKRDIIKHKLSELEEFLTGYTTIRVNKILEDYFFYL